jgi:hypothetical protein
LPAGLRFRQGHGLTSRNIPTPRGGDAWNAMSVMRAMKRLRIAGK